MITDRLLNAHLYFGLSQGIAEAFRFLQSGAYRPLPEGRHQIDGDRLFAIVQSSQTKPAEECAWEAHRKYIDVQFLAEGVVDMGYANIEGLSVKTPYDETSDIEWLDGDGSFFTLQSGSFAVFFPQDAHIPHRAVENKLGLIRKVVMKVALSA